MGTAQCRLPRGSSAPFSMSAALAGSQWPSQTGYATESLIRPQIDDTWSQGACG